MGRGGGGGRGGSMWQDDGISREQGRKVEVGWEEGWRWGWRRD